MRLILFLLNWKGNYICIPPGKITKAVGYFKENNLPILKILKNTISHKFLNTYILACDEIDKIYLSASHSYRIASILVSPFPKHLWINNYQKNSTEKNSKILFAPTERKKGYPSQITKILENEKFTEELLRKGFKILYSHHIHDLNSIDKINKQIIRFDGNWENIKIVVTDYSSIGADFLIAGGQKVVYYTKDKKEFLNHYGSGPLLDFEIKNGYEFTNQNDLLKGLNLDQLKKNKNKKMTSQNFFQNILLKIN